MVSGERRLEEMAAAAVVPELVPLLDDRPGEGRPEVAQEGGSTRADELVHYGDLSLSRRYPHPLPQPEIEEDELGDRTLDARDFLPIRVCSEKDFGQVSRSSQRLDLLNHLVCLRPGMLPILPVGHVVPTKMHRKKRTFSHICCKHDGASSARDLLGEVQMLKDFNVEVRRGEFHVNSPRGPLRSPIEELKLSSVAEVEQPIGEVDSEHRELASSEILFELLGGAGGLDLIRGDVGDGSVGQPEGRKLPRVSVVPHVKLCVDGRELRYDFINKPTLIYQLDVL
mmetsp:Transcript_43603/g.137933  ORF Transcript_43603/g.137933 Transcript_43603/m.137933 type:complete len:283 (+) Transcript_43603:128-976(+)